MTLDGGEWSVSCFRRFIPRGVSPRYLFVRRIDGPWSRFERGCEEKNPSVVQPIANRKSLIESKN